jgi:hypothetical protein
MGFSCVWVGPSGQTGATADSGGVLAGDGGLEEVEDGGDGAAGGIPVLADLRLEAQQQDARVGRPLGKGGVAASFQSSPIAWRSRTRATRPESET